MREKLLVFFVLIMLFLVPVSSIDVSARVVNFEGEFNSSGVQSGVDWWPMFRHDLDHSGYSSSKAPNTNNTMWNFTTSDGVDSSPAVADGKVYVGSNDRTIYCLDAETGAHIWNFTTEGGMHYSPAVVNSKVYAGSDSPDCRVYCLDAETGAPIWNFTTGGSVAFSSPAVSDGKVYVGSEDYNIYCLNASNGAHIWHYTTGDWIHSSPAVVDGKVYVGSNDKNVYCLNASNGHKKWNFTTGGVVTSSPAVVDGKVYVGSWDGNVYCLNASTGAHVWNHSLNGEVWSSPAVAYGKVYAASFGTFLYSGVYCLNASTGAHIWKYATGWYVGSSPAVADGKVYVGSYDKKVYCLNALTGTLIWSYTTGNCVFSSPAVADCKVYVGSRDKKVYAFGSTPSNYTLAITATIGGTTDPDPGTYTYPCDSSVSVTAFSETDYVFDHWELDTVNVGSANPYSVLMDADHTLHAVFVYVGIHDVAVTNVTPSKTVIGQGYSVCINVTVENQGDHSETFNVTVFANFSTAGELQVTLDAGENQTITFAWNTTGFVKGNYTISACAEYVPSEADLEDNSLSDGIVYVGIPGDVNGDGRVDLKDVFAVAIAYGSFPGHPKWNPNADINGDGTVDLKDYYAAVINYGK